MVSFFILSVIAAAFFGVYCEHEHQNAQGVIGVCNVNGISVGEVQELFLNNGDTRAVCVP